MNQSALAKVADRLARSDLVVAATGAGMSKESGIPTFRDAQTGLWARYEPQELASPQGFRDDPARVWGWYCYRRRLIARAAPHPGHLALATLGALIPQLEIVTQNIDGMHQRAGSDKVLELHGSVQRFKCFEQGHPADVAALEQDVDGPLEPPKCARCGSPIRPDVVWFGETLPIGVLERSEQLALACDTMLVVGTSGLVYPAAALPRVARSGGATVVEINVEPSELTAHVDAFLRGAAGVVLPQLIAALESRGAGRAGG